MENEWTQKIDELEVENRSLKSTQCTSPYEDSPFPCRGIQRERDKINNLEAEIERLTVLLKKEEDLVHQLQDGLRVRDTQFFVMQVEIDRLNKELKVSVSLLDKQVDLTIEVETKLDLLATGNLEAQHRAATENTRLRTEIERLRVEISDSWCLAFNLWPGEKEPSELDLCGVIKELSDWLISKVEDWEREYRLINTAELKAEERIKELEHENTDLRVLIQDAMDVVELFGSTETQCRWRVATWLADARKALKYESSI